MCVKFCPTNLEMRDAVLGALITLHDAGVWKTKT